MPMQISTTRATTTTSAEIINPWTIGLAPDFFMLEKEVFSPIAARAQTIMNLLALLVKEVSSAGISRMLARIAIARKPRMNQGNIFVMLKFTLAFSEEASADASSFLFMRNWIRENTVIIHFNGKHKPWNEPEYEGKLGEFYEKNKTF